MAFPVVTATYAAILALFYAALSGWVMATRFQFRVHHGDANNEPLNRRIRAHGNFAEYVPYILLLVGLLEADGARSATIHALLLPLLIARLMHPIGMTAPLASPRQFVFRGTAATATLAVLVAAALLLLIRVG